MCYFQCERSNEVRNYIYVSSIYVGDLLFFTGLQGFSEKCRCFAWTPLSDSVLSKFILKRPLWVTPHGNCFTYGAIFFFFFFLLLLLPFSHRIWRLYTSKSTSVSNFIKFFLTFSHKFSLVCLFSSSTSSRFPYTSLCPLVYHFFPSHIVPISSYSCHIHRYYGFF